MHQLNDCGFVGSEGVRLVFALWTFPVRCYQSLITSQEIDSKLIQTLSCLIKGFTSRMYAVNARRQTRTQKVYTSYCETSSWLSNWSKLKICNDSQ